MNEQRKVIYARRDQILEGADLKSAAMEYLAEAVNALLETYCASPADDEWDLDGLAKELVTFWPTAIAEDRLEDCRNTDQMYDVIMDRRHRVLRAARGRARRAGDARGRASGDAAHHRPALARAPGGDGLPQGGHQPPGDGPEGPADRVAARGLRDVRVDDEGHRPGLRALRDARPGRPGGGPAPAEVPRSPARPSRGASPAGSTHGAVGDASTGRRQPSELRPAPAPVLRRRRAEPARRRRRTTCRAPRFQRAAVRGDAPAEVLRSSGATTIEQQDGAARQGNRPAKQETVVKDEWSKTPRNAPCPCGSGKKFKMCHGAS